MDNSLEGISLGKPPERLLNKSAQNKVVGLKLSKARVVALSFAECLDFCVPEGKENTIRMSIDVVEDNQINMLGDSRTRYGESIKGDYQKEEEAERRGNNK